METTYALNENETLQEIKRPPRIGFIKTFAGTTPPEGTLLCDGSAVSRQTYKELFDAIGTTWGAGDGTNTFNLPDLRDVWILCAGTEHEAGDAVAEGLPNITGKVFLRCYAPGLWNIATTSTALRGAFNVRHNPSNVTTFFEDYIGIGGATDSYTGDEISLNAQDVSSIYGAQSHVTPASVAVLPCIVYE